MNFFKGLFVLCIVYISLFLMYLFSPGLDLTRSEKSLLGVCTYPTRSTADLKVTAYRL